MFITLEGRFFSVQHKTRPNNEAQKTILVYNVATKLYVRANVYAAAVLYIFGTQRPFEKEHFLKKKKNY